ncbi:uncharacterized protein LOC144630334 [Oculina patagonica]
MASEPNTNVVAKLDKALINANSGDDKNETALLMMSPSVNWAEFLTPAPLSIALLGQLMLVAGEKDFSLENQRPEKGFQFIQHPESFRACLVQVSNTGWRAFNEAHKNMDQIRLYSAQVPDQVKKVVRTLVKGSEKDVKDFLPIELGKIDRNATECLRLAQAVEAKFEQVMDLTGELLEVASAARGYYQKAQEEIKIKQEIALAKEKSAREKITLAKKQQEDLETQVKDAKAGWEKAVDSMPSGWDLIGMQFVETYTNTVSNTASTMLPLLLQRGVAGIMAGGPLPAGVQMPAATPSPAPNQAVEPSTEQTPTAVQTVPASVNGDHLKILITKLVEDLKSASKESSNKPEDRDRDKDENDDDDNDDDDDDDDVGDEEPVAKKLLKTKLKMEDLQIDWSSQPDSPHKKEALQLLKKGIKICMEGETMMTQLNFSPDKMEAIAKQASTLKSKVMKFCTKAQTKTGGNPFYTKPPRQARSMASSANSSSSSVAKSAVENARFKIAEAKGLLERQENRYDQTCKELRESNEELSKVLQSLAELSPEKIANFDQIRETLIQGIKALASVREQWQKLVEFFQFITNIIKVCQKESLASFVEYAKVGQKRVLANGYADTDFMRDLIYEQVNQANTTSYVVWSISNTYVEISRNHLMSRLASLGHLIALDPEKERHTIEAKRNELMEGSQEAQEAIRKLVSEAKDHFHEKVTKRIEKIETELLKALPSGDPAKIKEINDSVKNAIKEADEELGADKF